MSRTFPPRARYFKTPLEDVLLIWKRWVLGPFTNAQEKSEAVSTSWSFWCSDAENAVWRLRSGSECRGRPCRGHTHPGGERRAAPTAGSQRLC